MPVTDQQVAALRAYVTGDFDEHDRLFRQLNPDVDTAGWSALVAAGFFKAVYRSFKEATRADVVEFVASVRARSEQLSEGIDQQIAEKLIMHALGKGSISDIDIRVRHTTQLTILTKLVIDEQFDDADLDAFLAEARKIADQWTG